MAESLTSCELMRQCQWIQFQKDNHFTIFPQKYLKLYCKTENLLGMNADYGGLPLLIRSQSVTPSLFQQGICSGVLVRFPNAWMSLQCSLSDSASEVYLMLTKEGIHECYLPDELLGCCSSSTWLFLLTENLSQFIYGLHFQHQWVCWHSRS